MRINDWSSDVCSSDLGKNKFDRTSCDVAKSHLAKAGVPYASQDAGADWATVTIGQKAITIANPQGGLGAGMNAAGIPAKLAEMDAALAAAGYPAKEIGRASGRERVCQYG